MQKLKILEQVAFCHHKAFWNSNMTDEMIMGIKDPLNWTKATFERFGDISKKYLPKFQNLEKTYQTDAKEAFIKMKNIEAKGIKSIENLNSWFDQEGKFISDSNEYSKLRFFSSSAKVLSYSGKAIVGAEIAYGAYEVAQAKPNERVRTAYRETGKIDR